MPGCTRDDVTDETEVDASPSTSDVMPLGGEHVAVLAGEADRERAVRVDQPDDLALHLTDEHHAYDVHRLRRRDAMAASEHRLDAEPVEHGGDLRAAAVHDDGPQAGVPQEHDVLGERALAASRRSWRCRRT